MMRVKPEASDYGLNSPLTSVVRTTTECLSVGSRWWTILATLPAFLCVLIVRAHVSWFPLYVYGVGLPACIFLLGYAYYTNTPSEASCREPYGKPDKRLSNGYLPVVIVISMALLPLAIQVFYQSIRLITDWNFPGEPYELIGLATLQNAALASAVTARTQRTARLTITMSFFLMLFSVVISSAAWVYALAVLYGLMAIWWLMGDYWDRLHSRFIGQSSSTALSVRTSVLTGVACALFALAIVGVWIAPESRILSGFLPTSGGDKTSDPTSTGGVGEGEMLVSAKDQAFSFGPVESDLFIEDKQPSLYDMVSEIDGEAIKKKKAESAVSIDGKLGKTNHQRLANSEGSSREFSVVRRAPTEDKRKLKDQDSKSLIYYLGPMPQRLALETYDTFDGRSWTHQVIDSEILEEASPSSFRLRNLLGKPWIDVRKPDARNESKATWNAALKIIRLRSPRIPTPDELAMVHIDRIDRPDFYGWTKDEVLQLTNREIVPPLTVIKLNAQQRHVQTLRDSVEFARVASAVRINAEPSSTTPKMLEPYYVVPCDRTKLAATLEAWIKDVPRGWEQIDTIEDHLRDEFTLDAQSIAPEECDDVVSHFLESKRGPDYLFATTAAMMTRSLGYPTRLANGFYVEPTSFDLKAGQHLVRKEHLHWWPQVTIDGKNWISFEPTPTYLKSTEQLTWAQWGQLVVIKGGRWMRRNPVSLGFLAMTISVGFYWRKRVLDFVLTLWCRTAAIGGKQRRVAWYLWLLEKRAWLAGCSRPEYRTRLQWFTPLLQNDPQDVNALRILLRVQDQSLYAPLARKLDHADTTILNRACSQLLKGLTLSRLLNSSPNHPS